MSEGAHIGKVVDGRYRLDRLLGEGAAGAVYAATQLSVDRTVAVKLLHDANSDRFTAEARAIAKLNHTNVITLHDFGFDTELGAHFMVTEYAEGTPLSERISEVIGTDLSLRISLEIASALNHAHANGVLHRDLKPENVILTRADGRVDVAKVLDFGLAHMMDDSDDLETDDPTIVVHFDPEDEVRTNEVGRPVPDTDDFDRDVGETDEVVPLETQVDVEPPPAVLAEASDLLEDDVGETTQMEAMRPSDVGLPDSPEDEVSDVEDLEDLEDPEDPEDPEDEGVEQTTKMPAFTAAHPISEVDELLPADESAEVDLRKNLFEQTPSQVTGSSMIVTAEELETSVLPSMDLSQDSAFEEEE